MFSVALIFAAALFDFMDGFAARLLKSYSPLGKELDSLADLVSFGLAPSALLYYRYNQLLSPLINEGGIFNKYELLAFLPFIIVLFSALRLAKFNIDEKQTESFIGLPTPANALLIASGICFTTINPGLDSMLSGKATIPVISLILGYLLISPVPMFSLKTKSLKYKSNELRVIFLSFCLAIVVYSILTNADWSFTVLTIFTSYILINLLLYIFKIDLKDLKIKR